MKKDKITIVSWLWVAILIIGAFMVIITVNFNFQEKLLKEELIAHTAMTSGIENACICNVCGEKGLAYCMHCGTPMKWDKPSRHFVCPNCKTVGLPRCPKCNLLMSGMPKTKNNSNNVISGTPIPIY